jgi:hypothetical protein
MSNSVYGLSKEFLICDNLRFSRRAIGSNAQGLYGTPEKAQMASGNGPNIVAGLTQRPNNSEVAALIREEAQN